MLNKIIISKLTLKNLRCVNLIYIYFYKIELISKPLKLDLLKYSLMANCDLAC